MTATAIRTKAPSPRPVPRPIASAQRGCTRTAPARTARTVPARTAPGRTTPRPAPVYTVAPTAPAVYRRRRLAVAALALLVASVVLLLAGRVGHADAELDGPPPAPAVYVVQPGDTLWSIAEQVAPDVDRRDVVAQLSDAAGGSDLVPGQRIELPRYFD